MLVERNTRHIAEANDSAENAFGASRQELANIDILQLVHPDDREGLLQQIRIAMRRYHPRETECRLSTQPGGQEFRLYRAALCQLQSEDGDSILQLITTDITDEREAQRKNDEYLAELQSLNQKLEALSTTDEMTQISNFRFFKQRLADEHRRAIRFKRSYSILFFDIDHFKSYNDQHGHPAGDQLLKEFAQLLKSQCRETDFVARYGGEEFVILASETPTPNCMSFAERVRGIVASHPFAHASSQPLGRISVSIGVASYPESGSTPEEVLKSSDEAVYASKKAGRNRVTLSGAPVTTP